MALIFTKSFLNGLLFSGVFGTLLLFGIALYYSRKNYKRWGVKQWGMFKPAIYYLIFVIIVGAVRLWMG